MKCHNDEFKVIHEIGTLNQWKEENLLKLCKDLHIKLTYNKNNDDRDINDIVLFEELQALQTFVNPEMSPLR